ncbi:MAG: MBL fold metallo-hydrolase [Atopobiaceae bacterium]|nr:MBL fold metallo-hydrolase [Atopobiaceae bacterium]
MTDFLTVTVLVENGPSCRNDLICEHGLSLFLAYGDQHVLLDFGQSDAFAHNAEVLGIDLSCADAAVLSHAHYDHADGMPAFFDHNAGAPLYLSAACAENCWSTKGGTTDAHYIGIREGLLEQYASRFVRVPVDRVTTVAPGVHLVPHTTPNLDDAGRQAGMLLREGETWCPDGFSHELSLVVEVGGGPDAPLAIFNSCSHAGLPTILAEVQRAFPGRHIVAYVGGLHLVRSSDEDILQVARIVKSAGIERLYTGLCTGVPAIELLSRELPGKVLSLYPGLTFSLAGV